MAMLAAAVMLILPSAQLLAAIKPRVKVIHSASTAASVLVFGDVLEHCLLQ